MSFKEVKKPKLNKLLQNLEIKVKLNREYHQSNDYSISKVIFF